jgi:predicted nucleic acid-binding protein
VTFLDAYALIAFLIGGPAAANVRTLLREGKTAIAAPNLAETLDVSQRLYGLPVSRAMEALDPLFQGTLAVVALDLGLARNAAEIRARHYHRAECPISLADAVLIASAKPRGRVATADPHVLAIAEAEGIAVNGLPGQG